MNSPLSVFFLTFLLAISTSYGCRTAPPRSRNFQRKSVSDDRQLRKDIVHFAKKQLGRKYKYAGRSPKGFDCSGFTYFVMKKFDIHLSPSSRAQAKQGKKKLLKFVEAGDLIFFQKRGRVFHVALVVDNTPEGIKVIHSTSRGVVIDNISKSKYWKPKIGFARDIVSEQH